MYPENRNTRPLGLLLFDFEECASSLSTRRISSVKVSSPHRTHSSRMPNDWRIFNCETDEFREERSRPGAVRALRYARLTLAILLEVSIRNSANEISVQ